VSGFPQNKYFVGRGGTAEWMRNIFLARKYFDRMVRVPTKGTGIILTVIYIIKMFHITGVAVFRFACV
jgi:hypothetical protein